MSIRSVIIICCCALLVCSCSKRGHNWDAEYGRVYKRAGENDSGYRAPSVTSCVDDDLYNCN